MHVQEVIVIGTPTNSTNYIQEFEKQTKEDVSNLYKLIRVTDLNLECHTHISQQRFEKNQHRWKIFIIILLLMYLPCFYACVKLLLVVHQIEVLLDPKTVLSDSSDNKYSSS